MLSSYCCFKCYRKCLRFCHPDWMSLNEPEQASFNQQNPEGRPELHFLPEHKRPCHGSLKWMGCELAWTRALCSEPWLKDCVGFPRLLPFCVWRKSWICGRAGPQLQTRMDGQPSESVLIRAFTFLPSIIFNVLPIDSFKFLIRGEEQKHFAHGFVISEWCG